MFKQWRPCAGGWLVRDSASPVRIRLLVFWVVFKPYLQWSGVSACVYARATQTLHNCINTLAPPTGRILVYHTKLWYSSILIDEFLFHASGSDSLDSCTHTCTCMHLAGVNLSGGNPLLLSKYIDTIFASLLCIDCLFWVEPGNANMMFFGKSPSTPTRLTLFYIVQMWTFVWKHESWIMKLG